MDISDLDIKRDKPLLLLDADEVLLQFVSHLEKFLLTTGHELILKSFQLTGNVYHQKSGSAAAPETVKLLIAQYFEECVHNSPAVNGAADALNRLSDHYQIVVLSNVPQNCRTRRQENLAAQGMPYPVISNKGEKGPFASELTKNLTAQAVFVDDLPPQLKSVRKHAPDMHLVHFIADPRLAQMIGKAPYADVRHDDWTNLEQHLMDFAGA